MTSEDDSRIDRRTVLQTLGASTAVGLAGCSSDPTSRHFAAVPVVLVEDTKRGLEYGQVGHERLVEERGRSIGPVDADVVVESYLFSYQSGAGETEPERLSTDWPAAGAPTAGILSTPRAEALGEARNPLASTPIRELIAGPRGTELLSRAGILDDADRNADWRVRPERVDMTERQSEFFGGDVAIERYLGVIGDSDGPGRAVYVDTIRESLGSDAVLVAAGEQRALMAREGEALSGSECETINCLDEQLKFEERTSILDTILESVTICPAFDGVEPGNRSDVDLDDCVTASGEGSSKSYLHFDLRSVRLVQHLEETKVTFVGSSNYSEPDPPLVDGENTAVVFDIEKSNGSDSTLDDWNTSVKVDVERRFSGGRTESDRFLIPNEKAKWIIEDDADPRAVLHELAANGPQAADPVLFAADTDLESVHLSISMEDDPNHEWSAFGDDATLQAGPNGDFTVTDIRPLRVGFVAFHDGTGGDRFGTSQGDVRDYVRSVASAIEYLRRAYPGDLVAYRHDANTIKPSTGGLFCNGSCMISRHMSSAHRLLQRVATDPSFPSNSGSFPGRTGHLYLHGQNRSQAVNNLENNGFDVVVAIVPGDDGSNSGATDYYDHFDRPGVAGLAYNAPNTAVSAIGVRPTGNDDGISHTVAQEIGHYFQKDYLDPSGHPMAQRDDESSYDSPPTVNNKPTDPAHARHQSSDLRDRDTTGDGNNDVDNPPDLPGVVSTAYDLTDRFTNVQQYTNQAGRFSVTGPGKKSTSIGRVPSYMSYTNDADEVWSDARIHSQLIEREWTGGGTSGSGGARFMLSATGHIEEDGTVRYDDVAAATGVDEYTDVDDGPVTVRLLDPDGEVLAQANVFREIGATHGEESRIEAPGFTLPFRDRGVAIRTSHRGRSTTMNPIVRSVQDAVDRVPPAGVRGEDAGAASNAVAGPLDEIRAAMDDDDYDTAAAAMDGSVRDRIREWIVEYEAALNEPTRTELLLLVDEFVRRLRAL